MVVHDFALQMLHFKVKHTDTNVFGSIYLRLLINDIVTKQSYPLLIMSETVLNDRKPSWEKIKRDAQRGKLTENIPLPVAKLSDGKYKNFLTRLQLTTKSKIQQIARVLV